MPNTHSEAWKLECLARYIAKMPGVLERRNFLIKLGVLHGTEYREKMEALVRDQFALL